MKYWWQVYLLADEQMAATTVVFLLTWYWNRHIMLMPRKQAFWMALHSAVSLQSSSLCSTSTPPTHTMSAVDTNPSTVTTSSLLNISTGQCAFFCMLFTIVEDKQTCTVCLQDCLVLIYFSARTGRKRSARTVRMFQKKQALWDADSD